MAASPGAEPWDLSASRPPWTDAADSTWWTDGEDQDQRTCTTEQIRLRQRAGVRPRPPGRLGRVSARPSVRPSVPLCGSPAAGWAWIPHKRRNEPPSAVEKSLSSTAFL